MISIVVPTLNEARNLPSLVARIDASLRGRSCEVIVVDDRSQDGTAQVCLELSRQYPLRLHVRNDPVNGLSGAVIEGLRLAGGQYLVVMDADLQHPPEQIGELLAPLKCGEAEFVIGSRYVRGASTHGSWGLPRRIISRTATLLARPFAGGTSDPMSGFFALTREAWSRAGSLNPTGYKIALELLCKCGAKRVREVPIQFGLREAGRSKMNLRQQFKYLDHLSRLYDFCFPRAMPWIKLLVATGCAWFVAFSLYVKLLARDVNPVLAPTLAFAAVATMTALFHVRSLRISGHPIGSTRTWIELGLAIIGEWSVCALSARWIAYNVMHASALEVFIYTFSAAAVARYALRTRLLRKKPTDAIRGHRGHWALTTPSPRGN